MPLPLLALAGISALPSLLKGVQGIGQLNKAKNLKLQSTVPQGFMENLGLLRQDAGSQRLPGMGMLENQLAQSQGAASAAAMRAGGSSSSVLAAIGQADAQRQNGLANLAVQGQQAQQQARGRLSTGLLQLGQMQKADLDAYSRTKAGLKQAGNQNIFSGVEGLATNAAYFGSQAGQNAVNGVNQGGFNLLGGSPMGDYNKNLYRGYA